MKVTLFLTGRTRERYLREGIDEYIKRIVRYAPFKTEIIPDVKVSGKMTPDQVKKLEAERILPRIKSIDYVVLLDEKGKMFGSEDFADYLAGLERLTSHTVFVIGGAFGFSESFYQRANALVSLSKMTFSHQMARLIFVEQLYRAYSILKGDPYHHR